MLRNFHGLYSHRPYRSTNQRARISSVIGKKAFILSCMHFPVRLANGRGIRVKRRVVNEIRLDDSSKTRDVNRSITGLCRAYSLFVARAASLAPERSEGATSGQTMCPTKDVIIIIINT